MATLKTTNLQVCCHLLKYSLGFGFESLIVVNFKRAGNVSVLSFPERWKHHHGHIPTSTF